MGKLFLDLPVALAIVRCGDAWSFENVNSAFSQLFGVERQDFSDFCEWTQLISTEDRNLFFNMVERVISTRTIKECDIYVTDIDGDENLIRAKCSFYEEKDDVPYVAIVFLNEFYQSRTDARKKANKNSRQLTNLLPRQQTKKFVDDMIRDFPEKEHAMFVIGVDDLEEVNSAYGYTFGNTVLTDVAAAIQNHFRAEDVIGRVGGDEFLVFAQLSSVEQTIARAEALRIDLEKEYFGQEDSHMISASIGIACYKKDGEDYEELYEKANHAMHRAKTNGKNRIEFANDGDIGPVSPKKQSVDRREQLTVEDREFLTYAFGLMSHAKNIDGSLNLLLQRIAMRFGFELVALFENVTEQTEELTNYYSSCYNLYNRMIFPKTCASWGDKKPGDLIYLDRIKDLNVSDLHTENPKIDEAEELPCSGVVCTFEYIGERNGEIYYISLNPERAWESREFEVLKELTRAISVFVSLRARMNESKAEIRHIQRRDQLTGLYNYEAFKDRVRKIMKNPEPDMIYALEYLDINNFGYVNDNYGYEVGDSALKIFASDSKNQSYFRAGCRLYSDFFVFLLADTDKEALRQKLKIQHQRFANRQNHQYPSSSMGISAGVYLFEDKSTDLDNAIENVILAWKVSKTERRQEIVFFTSELRKKRMEEQQIIGDFFEALYRNEFQMYLQPKFVLGERSVYGAEALARWRKPDGTILSPGKFLEPLESIGYVTELDFYIFENLLKTMSRWRKQNRRLIIVSTNFSGRHFNQDGQEFLNRIFHLMSKYDVNPENIEIEITESVLVKNTAVLKKCMDKLHEWGFRVAIDDFGTGYSSLSVITEIPSDVVKMDKSFIDKGMTGVRGRMIQELGKMVDIVHKEIIFEGIETEEQEKMLLNCGFSHGQGYLCNRPIPAEDFEELYLTS
jgi:diguanylate cyclase (GGDEF)-like protein